MSKFIELYSMYPTIQKSEPPPEIIGAYLSGNQRWILTSKPEDILNNQAVIFGNKEEVLEELQIRFDTPYLKFVKKENDIIFKIEEDPLAIIDFDDLEHLAQLVKKYPNTCCREQAADKLKVLPVEEIDGHPFVSEKLCAYFRYYDNSYYMKYAKPFKSTFIKNLNKEAKASKKKPASEKSNETLINIILDEQSCLLKTYITGGWEIKHCRTGKYKFELKLKDIITGKKILVAFNGQCKTERYIESIKAIKLDDISLTNEFKEFIKREIKELGVDTAK